MEIYNALKIIFYSQAKIIGYKKVYPIIIG
jgi:hypothetical protein